MNLLRQLYAISSKSGNEGKIKSFIVGYLSSISLSVRTDEIGNLYITKGVADVYPCVAAHLDEIHIPVCNISCGYYDAHKNSEYTLFPELQNCLSFVRDVLKSIYQ